MEATLKAAQPSEETFSDPSLPRNYRSLTSDSFSVAIQSLCISQSAFLHPVLHSAIIWGGESEGGPVSSPRIGPCDDSSSQKADSWVGGGGLFRGQGGHPVCRPARVLRHEWVLRGKNVSGGPLGASGSIHSLVSAAFVIILPMFLVVLGRVFFYWLFLFIYFI